MKTNWDFCVVGPWRGEEGIDVRGRSVGEGNHKNMFVQLHF